MVVAEAVCDCYHQRMNAGEKLLKWRHEQGLSQKQAAEKAGLSQPAWQAYESGGLPRTPAASTIERITDGAVKVSDWEESELKRAERRARSKAKRVPRRAAVRAAS
jgi:transcriptional regulator with XRE-family HTH domain